MFNMVTEVSIFLVTITLYRAPVVAVLQWTHTESAGRGAAAITRKPSTAA